MLEEVLIQRFWSKVNKSSGIFGVDGKYTTECWQWTAGTRGKTGYGSFRIKDKIVDAHRASWLLHFGTITNFVLHKCDNRKCVNPEHLFQGTHLDNVADMCSKGRNYKPPKGRRAPVRHGTIDEYKTFGCRCDQCKEAQKLYMRQWRAKTVIISPDEPDE